MDYVRCVEYGTESPIESPRMWLTEEMPEIVDTNPKLTSTGKKFEIQQETRNRERHLNPVTHRSLGVPSLPIPVSFAFRSLHIEIMLICLLSHYCNCADLFSSIFQTSSLNPQSYRTQVLQHQARSAC